MTVTDRELLRSVDIGIAVASALEKHHPKEFNLAKFGTLVGSPDATQDVKNGVSLPESHGRWSAALASFLERRERYLIYR